MRPKLASIRSFLSGTGMKSALALDDYSCQITFLEYGTAKGSFAWQD